MFSETKHFIEFFISYIQVFQPSMSTYGVPELFSKAWLKNADICDEAYYAKDHKYPNMSPKSRHNQNSQPIHNIQHLKHTRNGRMIARI